MTQDLDITIRSAVLDDLPTIFHLGEDLFTSQDYSNLYRTWDEYEVTSMFNVNGEFMIVAEADEQVAGFILGSLIEKPRSAWNYGHLVWMGVDRDYAGRGIGQMLFGEFRKRMEDAGARMLLVDTQADNDPAIRFFTKLGFSNPIDHVYMTLNMEKT